MADWKDIGQDALDGTIGASNAETLSAPTITSLVAGDGTIQVNFSSVAGATGYNVYYSTSTPVVKGENKQAAFSSGDSISGLSNGTPYYVVVAAYTASIEGEISAEDSAVPTAGGSASGGMLLMGVG